VKQYEKEAVEYARTFTKDWDYFIVASDAYLSGFRSAKEKYSPLVEHEQVEYSQPDGQHQLNGQTFFKIKQMNYSAPLKELLIKYLPMVDFKDVRVVEDNGTISFQGTGVRVKL
jgi:hypothetical protein